MLNMALRSSGFDDILREIINDLESVLGSNYSKKQKDEVMYKTLGTINTLWMLLQVTEVSDDTESESDI